MDVKIDTAEQKEILENLYSMYMLELILFLIIYPVLSTIAGKLFDAFLNIKRK